MKKLLSVSLIGLAVAAASSAQARDYDHVRIGVDVPYVPMEYRTAEGDLTGFDIDLGNAMCEEIGVTCEWIEQEWDGIIPGLLSRNYDAVMSSMTINDERRQQVLFSEPYITMPSAWFAASDLDIDEANEETLEGLTIGVQRGTLQDNYVTDNYGSVADISRYSTADDMVLDMDAQRLDIVFLDFPIGQSTLVENEDGDYVIVGEQITEPKEYFGDGFGIAFRQRDEALAEKFNEALATLKEDGTYDEIYTRYFGEE
ncbi:amino acid ABC transporter substrate-binding protein (PAAT family) [Vreelandella songnenensis]|uniref:Amino acid ABC transporter substrate-binding protein (PAAT family) n=1 Tax=Vreelandella songnenensis TaxID=1176243 RepID=A0A2T0V020_9GAMM|nr:transporter substrate-binding domain-containing protein [Halomonas songnenensis]PRY63533.1 amino acid ABC transporter substrate-binding protein (PAAT family) [Halomonas songnenensis]